MKAVTLNGSQALTSNHKRNARVGWTLLIERLISFFDDSYESDWEKKRSLSLKVSFFG